MGRFEKESERNSTFQYFGQTIDLITDQTLLCTCPKAGFWIFQQNLNTRKSHLGVPEQNVSILGISPKSTYENDICTIFVLTSFCPMQ